MQIAAWTLPVSGEAAQPDLVLTPEGQLLLSWVAPREGGGHRLQLARGHAQADDPGDWSVVTVAEGDDWFVNWADTPHVWALADGSVWAHWLRSTGPGHMDYGIALARSPDAGRSWSAPALVNLPDVPGDHGFVSFWRHDAQTLGIAWLDSRGKQASGEAAQGHAHAHTHGAGAMMLRAALYRPGAGEQAPTAQAQWLLDDATCDCCPTATAMTADGPVVAYRGRSAGEIRDIRVVRLRDGHWHAPVTVHDDGWQIAGCPVNGPALASAGDALWVAWYTEAPGIPTLRLAHAEDGTRGFSAPVTLAEGPAVLGRVALAVAGDRVLAAWLEQAGDAQQLLLASMDRHGAVRRQVVALLDARGRASGMPRLVADVDHAWLVWVDVDNARPTLQGRRVTLE